ncbi:protein FAM76B-like [Oppia nitens]|uniref:protein FAM76B-like n=1 Tax=Oppia nitens TaxID=1686743 RepID=UPI0023DBCC8B|nr:protein FAM76B-like [Oppia nitens]
MSTSQSSSEALFACTRCNSRHPFEELSQGQQLCKECRGAFPIVKCTYCRTEFQQESKSSVISICKKCEQNVKQYGKPSACDYCNIIAAFIGSKCQRCANSEKKYGPPLTCEQCKQRCAFDRKDPESRKKVDGKLLCWLCTLSYKRALAKAKQNDSSIRHTSISALKSSSRSSSRHHSKDELRSHHKHHHNRHSVPQNSSNSTATKKPRIDLTKPSNGTVSNVTNSSTLTTTSLDSAMDPNSSETIATVAQLREQILALNKQIEIKKKELIQKDVEMNKLRSAHSQELREHREKITELQRKHTDKVQDLQQKIAQLSKQNASLSKAAKKSAVTPSSSPLL